MAYSVEIFTLKLSLVFVSKGRRTIFAGLCSHMQRQPKLLPLTVRVEDTIERVH
jgi:hypothetical protein